MCGDDDDDDDEDSCGDDVNGNKLYVNGKCLFHELKNLMMNLGFLLSCYALLDQASKLLNLNNLLNMSFLFTFFSFSLLLLFDSSSPC